jgi:hypothetical protein
MSRSQLVVPVIEELDSILKESTAAESAVSLEQAEVNIAAEPTFVLIDLNQHLEQVQTTGGYTAKEGDVLDQAVTSCWNLSPTKGIVEKRGEFLA